MLHGSSLVASYLGKALSSWAKSARNAWYLQYRSEFLVLFLGLNWLEIFSASLRLIILLIKRLWKSCSWTSLTLCSGVRCARYKICGTQNAFEICLREFLSFIIYTGLVLIKWFSGHVGRRLLHVNKVTLKRVGVLFNLRSHKESFSRSPFSSSVRMNTTSVEPTPHISNPDITNFLLSHSSNA